MIKRILSLCLLGASFAASGAQSVPADSTEIFTYATADGDSGLRLAIKDDRGRWKEVKDFRLVGSDFGAWGSGKKMYDPRLYRDAEAGLWYLTFNVDRDRTASALTTTADLIGWTVQEYMPAADVAARIPSAAVASEPFDTVIGGKIATGCVSRVPRGFAGMLTSYDNYRRQLDARYSERTSEDRWRFAGIDTLNLSIAIDRDSRKKISDRLIGIFFEDINYAADGGLYAELLQNRDFEYSPAERRNRKDWHATTAWRVSDPDKISLAIDSVNPLHPNNPHYALLDVRVAGGALVNTGYDSLYVKQGEPYRVSIFVNADLPSDYKLQLADRAGRVMASTVVKGATPGLWTRLEGTLTPSATSSRATLSIIPMSKGVHRVDLASLMPVNTFNNRQNGLRPDLARALADLKPRFVRFPGGCVAHGNGVDNIYDWKGSIGPLQERRPLSNLWGYHQSRGLGYHEYFLMCEDMGASPLPVLAAGVPCQNSSAPARHSHDLLTSHGQQCGIPMDEMPAYVQDVLDLIEYANGDPSTPWGSLRAAAGHPEPFGLKMIGIGNEDLISDVFEERFLMIYDAVRERYPEVEVVGTVGPFYEGPDYTAGWELAREHNVPIVDEHYYVTPGWLVNNGDFYDRYSRGEGATKVYLGEYASHLPDRASTLEAALSNALYLTGVERNADIVEMTSYAPLLAKKGHTQWRPDLIYFDNESVTLTPDYYVQKMYGCNSGTEYVASTASLDSERDYVTARVGRSVVIDSATGDMIVKLVNMTPVPVVTRLGIDAPAEVTLLCGDPDSTDAVESFSTIPSAATYTQPPYSFTVLRVKAG